MREIKKLRLQSLIGIALMIGFIPLIGLAITKSLTWLYVVAAVVLLVGLGLYSAGKNELLKRCEFCGASLTGAEYSYRKTMEKTDHRGDIKVSIEFKANCPSCKREKIIKKDYNGYRAPIYDNKSGEINRPEKYYDVDSAVKQDAKSFFE